MRDAAIYGEKRASGFDAILSTRTRENPRPSDDGIRGNPPLGSTMNARALEIRRDVRFLFGRYSGQIQARIERVWQRPRSAVNVGDSLRSASNHAQPDFRCQVRILQDAHGAVQEVQIIDCNGGIVWQQSLVTAILAASPLPAPPNPAVFTQSLTMTFAGRGYTPGSSTNGYDIDRTVAIPVAGGLR